MNVSCIFSNQYRFVYVSTPKVACTSIKRALLPLFHESDMTSNEIEAESNYANFHKYLRKTRIHMRKYNFEKRMKKGEFEDFFRFSFVRNPWDRLVSCYESKVIQKRKKPVPLLLQNKENPFVRGMSFADFIETVCDIPDENANVHFVPQSKILVSSEKSNEDLVVDFVGRFEKLAVDFEYVMSKITPHKKIDLNEWNKSKNQGKGYRQYFDERLAEIVAKKYADDIARFDYEF